ncbi:hypothetical protein RJ640_003391 [Escallonia rubra]|uniref:Reverse transcriptase Ty1/copia-type domain-containing protein n=1 Tax=Escallonia rubra TaxID=112253 RepID=A0AA88U1Q2_9ASTE|nr:hypothetical protein RJ640_003391 [Escallonia rubra]
MAREFEMTDIGLMSYYLSIEVRQMEDGIFISQEAYAKEILKRYGMVYCKPVKTPVECGVKLSKHGEGDKIHPTFFKSLVESLRYLTCTRPDILFGVRLVSRYMEAPTTSHLKVAKRILRLSKVHLTMILCTHLLKTSSLSAIVIVIGLVIKMIEKVLQVLSSPPIGPVELEAGFSRTAPVITGSRPVITEVLLDFGEGEAGEGWLGEGGFWLGPQTTRSSQS